MRRTNRPTQRWRRGRVCAATLALVLACERGTETRAREAVDREPRAASATARDARERALVSAAPGSADANAPALALRPVAEGVPQITDVEFVPGHPRSVVVTSQLGRAALFELAQAPGAVARPRATVLELEVDSELEMGLLSLAFHPDYERNGRVFVHYNPRGKQATRIAEFALPSAQLGSAPAREQRVLLELDQPYKNHNGGELAFGPDGALYLGLGDGGAAGDPHHNGQNLGSLLGKILRFDVARAGAGEPLAARDNPFVDRSGARAEIFAYGLRNPWKISFDPRGRLIAADVGQNRFEEIDLIGAGDNLGWNTREGRHCYEPRSGCATRGLVEPIFEYGRDLGLSVTGGYVYTGQQVSALAGRYVFGDFGSGRLWVLALPEHGGERAQSSVLGVFPCNPSAFGRDAEGELYLGDYRTGRLLKLVSR